jgi:hypothetical protein
MLTAVLRMMSKALVEAAGVLFWNMHVVKKTFQSPV